MPGPRDLEGLKILILEDELIISSALRDFFLMAGASVVETAPTLELADPLVAEQDFDAAVVDVLLSDGGTRDFAASLAKKGVAILFHSGQPLPEGLETLLPRAGYAMKPSEPLDLVRRVAGLVRGD